MLEYAVSVWNPYRKEDISRIDKVQTRATKKGSSNKLLPYKDSLKRLKLLTLKFGRIRGNMIVYKAINFVGNSVTKIVLGMQ